MELKELSKHRRKEPELQNSKSQIDGLEHRLRYSTKDKETTVSYFVLTMVCHRGPKHNVFKHVSKL